MRFAIKNNVLVPELLCTSELSLSFYPISKFPTIPLPLYNKNFIFSPELQTYLQGKQLLFDEIPFPPELIHSHYEHGYVLYQHGITSKGRMVMCKRCGNHEDALFGRFHCARCGTECMYCRKCITMGRVSQCTPLISWVGPEASVTIPGHVLNWSGSLSEGQQAASDAVTNAIKENQQLLVWAVCGAGKTEVLFQGVEAAILAKKKVCIATPRTDVVIELAPRLKASFPEIDVIALYGGSEDRGKSALLTLATTHQLLRFYRAFDVVVIDEVDAFPYSSEPMLQYAVINAKKEQSATIFLSATPSAAWQKEVIQGKRNAVTIPARFHRYPLPVPHFEWCGNWKKQLSKKKLPQILLKWIAVHLQQQKQAFLFAPHITTLNEIIKLLQPLYPAIQGVHSEDPERKEKVAAFRKGEIPILLTTTILERGVTVPNIDVAVLGAEDLIFTESALVQISGRVGRSPNYPSAGIVFFHYGKTNAMILAKKQIEQMNNEAREKGMLVTL